MSWRRPGRRWGTWPSCIAAEQARGAAPLGAHPGTQVRRLGRLLRHHCEPARGAGLRAAGGRRGQRPHDRGAGDVRRRDGTHGPGLQPGRSSRREVRMVNAFKDYFIAHGQEVYENPSPGNREGGITTLEEKSLGCIRKAGTVPVDGRDRLRRSPAGQGPHAGLGPRQRPGLHHGAHRRGRPADPLHHRPRHPLRGARADAQDRLQHATSPPASPAGSTSTPGASSRGPPSTTWPWSSSARSSRWPKGKRTKAELGGYREIAIFKDGVTL